MTTTLDIKEPGLNVLPPGVERHSVNIGGLTGLQIFPDDQIEVINEEGNQICEIICFSLFLLVVIIINIMCLTNRIVNT